MSENITMLDVTKVNENQLPAIISTQFNKLTDVQKSQLTGRVKIAELSGNPKSSSSV